MNIEKRSRNNTEARHSVSMYPIPIRISAVPRNGLTEIKAVKNNTGNIQKIYLSIHIAVTVRKEDSPCLE